MFTQRFTSGKKQVFEKCPLNVEMRKVKFIEATDSSRKAQCSLHFAAYATWAVQLVYEK